MKEMEIIITLILGVVFIGIGILNRKGNISMLHSYHRKRVTEENRLPFGKLVGAGTIVIGISLILMGILSLMGTVLLSSLYITIGNIVFIVGLVVGLIINFYAMIKYNKGIF